MTSFCPFESKKILSSRIEFLSESVLKEDELSSLYVSAGLDSLAKPCFFNQFHKVVDRFFFEAEKKALHELSELGENSPIRISLDRKNFDVEKDKTKGGFYFTRKIDDEASFSANLLKSLKADGYSLDRNQASIEAIGFIDMQAVKEDIEAQASTFQKREREKISELIFRFFNINSIHKAPFVKSRRMVFSTSSYSRGSLNFSFLTDLERICLYLSVIDKKLSDEFKIIADRMSSDISSLSYSDDRLPSRTTYGKGKDIEIVCFKEKYEFRLTQHAFEKLQAFFCLYGSSEIVNKTMEIAELLGEK